MVAIRLPGVLVLTPRTDGTAMAAMSQGYKGGFATKSSSVLVSVFVPVALRS